MIATSAVAPIFNLPRSQKALNTLAALVVAQATTRAKGMPNINGFE
jgi:hypothetical protein